MTNKMNPSNGAARQASTSAATLLPQHFAVGLTVLIVSVGIRQMSIPTLPAAIGALVVLMTLSSQHRQQFAQIRNDQASACGQAHRDRRLGQTMTSSPRSRSRAGHIHDSHPPKVKECQGPAQMQRGDPGDHAIDGATETNQSVQLQPMKHPTTSTMDSPTLKLSGAPRQMPQCPSRDTAAIERSANTQGIMAATEASVGAGDGPDLSTVIKQDQASLTVHGVESTAASPTPEITSASPSTTASPTTTDPAANAPDALMFVVHGMGRQSWLGQNVANVRAALAALQDDPRLARNIRRVHVVPVEYHSKLHARTSERVDAIKLSSCAALRTVINDFAVDPLYYFSASNGKYVRDEVTRQLNSLYASFLQTHASFRGEVTILAHSMGGLVMWDLLNSRPNDVPGVPSADTRLTLPIHRVFCMGSPIANAIVLRGHNPKLYAPRVPFFNVYHPHDPIAYRFEPIWDSRWQHVPPVALGAYAPPPAADNGAGHVVAYYRRASWAMVNGNGQPLHRRLLGSIVAQIPAVTMPQLPLMPQFPPMPQLPPMPQFPPIPQLPAFPTVVTNGVRSLVATVSMMAAGGAGQRQSRTGRPGLGGSAQAEDQRNSSESCDDGYMSDNEEGCGQGDDDLISLNPRTAAVSIERKAELPPVKRKLVRAEERNAGDIGVNFGSGQAFEDDAVDTGAVSSTTVELSDPSASGEDNEKSDSLSTGSQAENPPPLKRRKLGKRHSTTVKPSAKPNPVDNASPIPDHAGGLLQSPDILTTTAATLWAMFMGGDHSASSTSMTTSTSASTPPTNPTSGTATPTVPAGPADTRTDAVPAPDTRKRKRTRSASPGRDTELAGPGPRAYQQQQHRRRRAPTSEGDAAVSAFTEFIVASTATVPDAASRKCLACRAGTNQQEDPAMDENMAQMAKSSPSHTTSLLDPAAATHPRAPPTPASLSPSTSTCDPALATLPFMHRLDFELPVAKPSLARSRIRHVDVAQEYLSGLRAHFEYWTSKDAMWFVLLSLNGLGPAARTMPRLTSDLDGGVDCLGVVEEEVNLDGAEWIERSEVVRACGNGKRSDEA